MNSYQKFEQMMYVAGQRIANTFDNESLGDNIEKKRI